MQSEEMKSVLVYFRGEVSVLIQNRKSFESVFFQRFVGFVDLEVIRSRSEDGVALEGVEVEGRMA